MKRVAFEEAAQRSGATTGSRGGRPVSSFIGRGTGQPDVAVPSPTGFPTTGEELRVFAIQRDRFLQVSASPVRIVLPKALKCGTVRRKLRLVPAGTQPLLD
jgi:hypothetical protein